MSAGNPDQKVYVYAFVFSLIIAKGVFSLEESLKSLKSLDSLENGRLLLCFPQSGNL